MSFCSACSSLQGVIPDFLLFLNSIGILFAFSSDFAHFLKLLFKIQDLLSGITLALLIFANILLKIWANFDLIRLFFLKDYWPLVHLGFVRFGNINCIF